MVFSETMNYHANHIGAIRTNKESLKTDFNVEINITRRRFGEYQEVDITGISSDIRKCKKALQNIVEQAEFDYQDYLNRKRRRESMKPRKEFKVPVLTEKKKRANVNPFAALEGLDEDEAKSSDENLYEQSFPPLSTYDPNVSWGDMCDDE